MKMFCFQCQETSLNTGCTVKGVCGEGTPDRRTDERASVYRREEAIVNRALREKGDLDTKASRQILDALFCTITNANFDDQAIEQHIATALAVKNELIGMAKKRGIDLPERPEVTFYPQLSQYETVAGEGGVLSMQDEDPARSNNWRSTAVRGRLPIPNMP